MTMTTNRTFTMIKPDAVENGHIGAILEKITAAGFRIVALKKTQLTVRDAEAFYSVHSERPFFGELGYIYDTWTHCCSGFRERKCSKRF